MKPKTHAPPDTKAAYTELMAAMLMHQPFFGSLLFNKLKVEFTSTGRDGGSIPTAATDGRVVYLNPDFLASLTLKERMFVLCHEVAHAMWMHMDRMKGYKDGATPNGKPFNPQLFNMAADYVINYLLHESGVGQMPQGNAAPLYDSQFTSAMTAEQVYNILYKQDEKKPKQQSAGKSGQGSGHGGFDQHLEPDAPASGTPEAQLNEAQWKAAVAGALAVAKAVGKMPASLQRVVDSMLESKVPWQEILRLTLERKAGRGSHTWAKLNRRRLISQRVVMPGKRGFSAGPVVVAVDTSGSIGGPEITRFLSETQAIIDDLKPEVVYLVPCDAAVHTVTELHDGDRLDSVKPPLKGGGGTDFRPVFDYINKLDLRSPTLVYFTDMMGTFPAAQPAYPVIWCATTQRVGPFGTTIKVEV